MKPAQVQRLLTNSNLGLIEAFEQGLPPGDYSMVTFWLEYLLQETIFTKMIRQFADAFEAGQEIDVLLILGAVKCGLYSQKEDAARLALELLLKINESLRRTFPDQKYDVNFAKWFIKVVRQPDDSALHNSVLQSVAECLEMHHGLVQDVARLLKSIFDTHEFKLSQLPGLLKQVYEDDIFMMYETMHAVLSDLNKLDRESTK